MIRPREAPYCPDHHDPMVLRTAKIGRRAGGKFWGCTKYRCKRTVDAGEATHEVEPESDGRLTQTSTFVAEDVPRVVSAAPSADDMQVQFYQACALPSPWVIALEDVADPRLLRTVAQWRLDYPIPRQATSGEEERATLSVAHSLLTRGNAPFCLPAVEERLLRNLPQLTSQELTAAMRVIALRPTAPYSPTRFESDAEGQLYSLVRSWHGSESDWTVHTQVDFASLVVGHSRGRQERVDFLFAHPDGDTIVVEVDGSGHQKQQDKDRARDQVLANAGFRTVRVPTREIRNGSGPRLDKLFNYLGGSSIGFWDGVKFEDSQIVQSMRVSKILHQLQIAILQAVRGGWLAWNRPWRIGCILPEGIDDDPDITDILNLGADSCRELLDRLSGLHGADFSVSHVTVDTEFSPETPVDILVSFVSQHSAREQAPTVPLFLCSDVCFPAKIAASIETSPRPHNIVPSKENVLWFLCYIFRKDSFREGQWETIERTLMGRDSIVLLPTGGGKSIAFQLAAMLLPGRCIVVEPIISLIDDQIDNLKRVGIDSCIGISSQLGSQQEQEPWLRAFSLGHYLFCYVSPERFQRPRFRESLRTLTAVTPVSVVAIDEAHCVSEWGHDFRTSYLSLGRIAREYCATLDQAPPLVALTGTASKIVLKDLQRELDISDIDGIISPNSFDRQELRFYVLTGDTTDKPSRILGFLNRMPSEFGISSGSFFQPMGAATASGLVFCPHVNGELGVVEQSRNLSRALGVPVDFFAGGAPRKFDTRVWNRVRRETASRFKRNEQTVMACTKAYGVGIDKPNIRYTVHLALPESIESFYQEAGRAGRDGRPAMCGIVLSNDNPKRAARLLDPGTTLEDVARELDSLDPSEDDDVTRALRFHVRSFRGVDAETDDVADVVARLAPLDRQRAESLSESGAPAKELEDRARRTEKALHRLVVIGVVQDYTMENPLDFKVKLSGASMEEIANAYAVYASSYQRGLGAREREKALRVSRTDPNQFVIIVAGLLIKFVYTHIERARRHSLNEMLLAASSASTGDDLRLRILDYLQHSEFDFQLEDVVASSVGGLDTLDALLDDMISNNDAVAIRGSVARLLGSYPDNPGLLLLRATSEILSRDCILDTAIQNLQAALNFALGEYRLEVELVANALGKVAASTLKKAGAAEALTLASLGASSVSRDLVRHLLAACPKEVSWILSEWLSANLADRSAAMRSSQR